MEILRVYIVMYLGCRTYHICAYSYLQRKDIYNLFFGVYPNRVSHEIGVSGCVIPSELSDYGDIHTRLVYCGRNPFCVITAYLRLYGVRRMRIIPFNP